MRRCFWLYAICIFLLIVSIGCLICPIDSSTRIWSSVKGFINNYVTKSDKINKVILVLGTYLKSVADKDGIKAVISSIGIYAVAFAWLVGIQQQKVYGVTIGTLLRWAYPGFYRFYFVVFIGMDLVGLYASSIPGKYWATGFSVVGIGIGVIYSMWVCYRFVLDFQARYRIAESYHYSHITLGQQRREKTKKIPMRIFMIYSGLLSNIHPDECRAGYWDDKEIKCKIEESVSLLGSMLAEQVRNAEQIHISAIFDLWDTAYSGYKNMIAVGGLCAEKKNELCFLAERLWDHALSDNLSLNMQAHLAGSIMTECHKRKGWQYKESIDCLMAGLLLSLSNDKDGMENGKFKVLLPMIIWEERSWLQKNEKKPVFYLYEELVLGYLWMTCMLQCNASSTFLCYLNDAGFIIKDIGIISYNDSDRMEKFMITIDNAFSDIRAFSKDRWTTKQGDEGLFEKILNTINRYYNIFRC